MKVLDVGCGRNKRVDAIGIDVSSDTHANVVHDLNTFPYPFSDNEFDEIYCTDVLEHLIDLIKVVEELCRIAKPKAKIFIAVPHFSSVHAYGDLTHRHFFSTDSFKNFTEENSPVGHYSRAKLKQLSKKIVFWKLHQLSGISYLANKNLTLYEKLFAFIFTSRKIDFVFEVVK